MKKILIIFIFITSLIISSISFADWEKVGRNIEGDQYFINFIEVRKHGEYVYYWELTNYIEPSSQGDLSHKMYIKAYCNLFRKKWLSSSFHKEPMGKGSGNIIDPSKHGKFGSWAYDPPNSIGYTVLKSVCKHIQ